MSRDEAIGGTARGPPALVAAVGHDKAGALAILQQSIVPDLVTETPVTGCFLTLHTLSCNEVSVVHPALHTVAAPLYPAMVSAMR